MLLMAFLCFAVLIAAWLMAPGAPLSMPSMLSMDRPESAPADVELQH